MSPYDPKQTSSGGFGVLCPGDGIGRHCASEHVPGQKQKSEACNRYVASKTRWRFTPCKPYVSKPMRTNLKQNMV